MSVCRGVRVCVSEREKEGSERETVCVRERGKSVYVSAKA